MKNVEESLKSLHAKIDKSITNVKFVVKDEEEIVITDAINVRYAIDANETELMLLDSGCPKEIVGKPWLVQYLKKTLK